MRSPARRRRPAAAAASRRRAGPSRVERTCTEVSAGSMPAAIGRSAKPITAMPPGTAMRRRWHSNSAPAASMSLVQNTARGGARRASNCAQRAGRHRAPMRASATDRGQRPRPRRRSRAAARKPSSRAAERSSSPPMKREPRDSPCRRDSARPLRPAARFEKPTTMSIGRVVRSHVSTTGMPARCKLAAHAARVLHAGQHEAVDAAAEERVDQLRFLVLAVAGLPEQQLIALRRQRAPGRRWCRRRSSWRSSARSPRRCAMRLEARLPAARLGT